MDHEGLRLGMLLGGAVMALVPVLVGVGLGTYLLKQYRIERDAAAAEARAGEGEP